MSNPAHGSPSEGTTSDRTPALPATADTIERYETDNGTVIYDAANPMAWIYSECAVKLPSMQ